VIVDRCHAAVHYHAAHRRHDSDRRHDYDGRHCRPHYKSVLGAILKDADCSSSHSMNPGDPGRHLTVDVHHHQDCRRDTRESVRPNQVARYRQHAVRPSGSHRIAHRPKIVRVRRPGLRSDERQHRTGLLLPHGVLHHYGSPPKPTARPARRRYDERLIGRGYRRLPQNLPFFVIPLLKHKKREGHSVARTALT
jgi:hypothetical protein